jgi:hypothetical protein
MIRERKTLQTEQFPHGSLCLSSGRGGSSAMLLLLLF